MKKLVATVLCIGMILSLALVGFADSPAASESSEAESAETIVSGSWGENFSWSLDKSTGVLTISGDGDMPLFTAETDSNKITPPWNEVNVSIKKVIIEEGITSISEEAFLNDRSLTEVQFPSTVKLIGSKAFQGCTRLADVQIPEGVELIDSYAFYGCKSIVKLGLPKSLQMISHQAFQDCDNLAYIYYAGTKQEWKDLPADTSVIGRSTASVYMNGQGYTQTTIIYSNGPLLKAKVYYESAFGEINKEKNSSWLARLFGW